MQNKEVYHASAISYNEAIMKAAEAQAKIVQDPVVRGWCKSIARLHRFHLKHHRAALAWIQSKNVEVDSSVRVIDGPIEVKSLSLDLQPNAFGEGFSIAEQQAEFAAEQEKLAKRIDDFVEAEGANEGNETLTGKDVK